MSASWSSRERQGKNIAVENSFRLNYQNFSSQPQSVRLFSLGSANINQSINTAPNSFFLIVDMSSCVNSSGLFYVATDFYIEFLYSGVNPLYNGTYFPMVFGFYPIGFNVNNMFFNTVSQAYAYEIPDSGGLNVTPPFVVNMQFVDFPSQTLCREWYVEAVDQANSIYKFVFPNVFVNRIRATDQFTSLPLFSNTNVQIFDSSLNQDNPFVQTRTETPVSAGAIQQSSNGSTIGVLCLDIYSENKTQVLEGIGYRYKDANGDVKFFNTSPIINPYQPQVGSISCLDLENIQVNTQTTVSYNILPDTSALLTYNYVRFTIDDYYEFDKVFRQQLRDNYFLQQKLLKRSRINSLLIE